MQCPKFKFVVSSSESEENFGPENLIGLSPNGRTKWRGKAGTDSNVAVLQLEREVKIKSVNIGNEFSALITVNVAKSSDPKQVYNTLVPTTSFMDPLDSRYAKNGNRVKMFSEIHLIKSIAQQKWDLVKIICTQPFNQRVPYGISFIELGIDDEHKISEANVAHIANPVPQISVAQRKEPSQIEYKMGQMFSNRDEISVKPVVQKMVVDQNNGNVNQKHKTKQDQDVPTKRKKNSFGEAENRQQATSMSSSSTDIRQQDTDKKSTNKSSNQVLHDVKFSLSGYLNPERSIIRDKAKDLGAKYENNWTPQCTHLVCAFKNTPKFSQATISRAIIVTEKWIEMCHRKKKRVPEADFSLT